MISRHPVGPRSRAIVAREAEHIAPGLQSLALYSGLAMARGTGSTLVDEDGKAYIDFVAGVGVGSVGHCHPDYVDALIGEDTALEGLAILDEALEAVLRGHGLHP